MDRLVHVSSLHGDISVSYDGPVYINSLTVSCSTVPSHIMMQCGVVCVMVKIVHTTYSKHTVACLVIVSVIRSSGRTSYDIHDYCVMMLERVNVKACRTVLSVRSLGDFPF